MSYDYTSEKRRADKWSLPDVEIFQLTADEAAELDEDLLWEYSRRHEFRLASMNSGVREMMIAAIVEEQGIEGGWFYAFGFPGCLHDGPAIGPFKSYADALTAAREDSGDDEDDSEEG